MKERLNEEAIAMRVAKELKDGEYVNLGFGIGSMVPNFIPPEKRLIFHTENGALGYGRILTLDEPELMDYNLINAGAQYIHPKPGMSLFDIAEAFDAIRVGRVSTTVLGGLQVSEKGDLANWSTDPNVSVGNIGGAMDMPVGAKRVIVGMTHTTKQGKPKIVKKCTLPLTAPQCVDSIITDVAMIEVTAEGLVLKEFVPGWTVKEIQAITEPKLIISSDLREMELL
jgi:3-oxoacid CoA-transferase B subunit